MKKLFATASAAVMALALAACSNGDSEGGASGAAEGEKDATQVDVVSWWSAGSEKEGLEALQGVFAEQFPDTTFTNEAVSGGGGSQAKQKLQADLAAKNPPDTYQAHAGAELSADIEAGYLEDVSYLYDEFNLRDAFPQDLIDRVTVDGMIYSIPSNVHRANVVWVSAAALEKADIDPATAPADIDAWLDDMAALKDAGVEYPLGVGDTWAQLELLETVLIADMGAEDYQALMDGEGDWTAESVTTAFGHYAELMTYANPSLLSEDWEPAMKGIINNDGTQAYSVMGDWTAPAFEAAGKTMGTDYFAWPTPGTEGVYDFLADSFTLPVGAEHVGGAENWLNTISSKDGQIAFNSVKGSIPARSDLTDEEKAEFSEYQLSAMDSFSNDTIVSSIAHGAALPLTATEAMKAELGKFNAGSMTIEELQAAFAEDAAL